VHVKQECVRQKYPETKRWSVQARGAKERTKEETEENKNERHAMSKQSKRTHNSRDEIACFRTQTERQTDRQTDK
jgi:hypothetical protein